MPLAPTRTVAALALVAALAGTAHAAPSWLWIRTDGGYQTIDLRRFDVHDDDDLSAGFVPQRATGPHLAVGAGVRLFFFTIGPRLSVTHFDDDAPDRTVDQYDLWSFDLEAGLRGRLGRFEPHLVVAGGYSTFGGFDDAITRVGQGLDIDGAHLRGAVGLDYLVTRRVTLGLRLGGELLFLAREGMPVRDLAEPREVDTIGEARARLLEADGSSAGTAHGVTAGIGFQW